MEFLILKSLFENREKQLSHQELHDLVSDQIGWNDFLKLIDKFTSKDYLDDSADELKISQIGINRYIKLNTNDSFPLAIKNNIFITGIVLPVVAGLILAGILYIAGLITLPWENNIKTPTQKDTINTTPLNITFTDGQKGIVKYNFQLSVIKTDSIFIQANSRFVSQKEAINHLKDRVRNKLIIELEKTSIDSARLNRAIIEQNIDNQTLDDQLFSGHQIINININEIQ